MILDFEIPGAPVAKGRPRMTRTGHAYTPEKTASYENLVKLSYIHECGQTMFDGEISCVLTAYFPIPKSASKKKREQMRNGAVKPTKKPDIDNIIKSVADALNGVAYHDDSQIVSISAAKMYSDNPRVHVVLTARESEGSTE